MTISRALAPTHVTTPAARTRIPLGPVRLEPVGSPAERDADTTPRDGMLGWSYAGIPLSRDEDAETIDVRVDGEGRPVHELPPPVGGVAEAPGARIHTGPAAADTARRAGAHALTVGADILFAAGRFAPQAPEGTALLGHELRHAAQWRAGDRLVARRQPKPGAVAAPATTLTGLPEADRKRIQVTTDTPVTVPGVQESFAANATPETLPTGTTLAIDASAQGVPAAGLRNIVARLIDAKPSSALPKNTTLTLELALGAHGGVDGLYRFTYHSPPVPSGATAADRVLVEQLGAATAPPGQAVPPSPSPGKPAKADPIAAKLTTAGIAHSLAGAQLEALRGAVSLVPTSQLAVVRGLTIQVGNPGSAAEDGEYDLATHTVTLRASIFTASDLRVSERTRAVSYATQVILHEIGHAVDYAPLRAAQTRFLAAGAAQNKALAKYADASGNYPLGGKQEAAIKAAAENTKAAKDALERTKGRSGTTASIDPSGTPAYDTGGPAKGSGFREAVEKDGIAVSAYGATDWSEAWAEAYALYLSSPEVLKSLRPATFAYLKGALP